MRDPHEPVIPGQHKHPKEGHGGFSMPIGVSGDLQDRHQHVGPGVPAVDTVPRAEHELPSAADLDAVETEKATVENMLEGQKLAEPSIDEQLAEELKTDEPQS